MAFDSMPDGRYGNRQQGSYDNGYSDEEGGPPRQTAVGGRPRYTDHSSHGRSYHHRGDQMRRHNMGKPGMSDHRVDRLRNLASFFVIIMIFLSQFSCTMLKTQKVFKLSRTFFMQIW